MARDRFQGEVMSVSRGEDMRVVVRWNAPNNGGPPPNTEDDSKEQGISAAWWDGDGRPEKRATSNISKEWWDD
eukprot:gene13275-9193_t